MLLITLGLDIVWIMFWNNFWSSSEFNSDYWETGVNNFSLFTSIIGAVLKVINRISLSDHLGRFDYFGPYY